MYKSVLAALLAAGALTAICQTANPSKNEGGQSAAGSPSGDAPAPANNAAPAGAPVKTALMLGALFTAGAASAADEPKPTPENTISVRLAEAVPAQKFEHPLKFWITDVTDRSGNAQPMLVRKERGGVFLDRLPTVILREAIQDSMKAADLLAADAASADLTVRLYLFHFGLAEGSRLDFFSKVEFSAMVKNPKTGETQEVRAAGTSIANTAVRKKNIQKNVEENLQEALKDATRNFLRGTQLKEAVKGLWKGPEAAAAGAGDAKHQNGPDAGKP